MQVQSKHFNWSNCRPFFPSSTSIIRLSRPPDFPSCHGYVHLSALDVTFWPKTNSLRRINRACCGPCWRSTSEALRYPSHFSIKRAYNELKAFFFFTDILWWRAAEQWSNACQCDANGLKCAVFPQMDLLPRWIYTWSGCSMLLCTWAHMWSDAGALESVCTLELMSSLFFFHFNSSRSIAPPHRPLTPHTSPHASDVHVQCVSDVVLTDRVTAFWGNTDVDMIHRKCTHLNTSVVCRHVKCQHVTVAPGLFKLGLYRWQESDTVCFWSGPAAVSLGVAFRMDGRGLLFVLIHPSQELNNANVSFRGLGRFKNSRADPQLPHAEANTRSGGCFC